MNAVSETIADTLKAARYERAVKCQKCRDAGIVFYWRKVNGRLYEYIAHCTCAEGLEWRYDGRRNSKDGRGYYIPSIDTIAAGINPFTGEFDKFDEQVL